MNVNLVIVKFSDWFVHITLIEDASYKLLSSPHGKPTGIYPIKDINKNNLRQIFSFAPIASKDTETNVADQKALPDASIDAKPITSDKDTSVKTSKGKETGEESPKVSGDVETAKAIKDAGKVKTTKTSEAPGKEETTEAGQVAPTNESVVETTEGTGVSSTAAAVGTSPLDAIDEHSLSAGTTETSPEAGNATEKAEATAGGEETSNQPNLRYESKAKSKHEEVEGSGELHEGSGNADDTTSTIVDSTTLLTGNGSEPDENITSTATITNKRIAKDSSKSLPTITIPQNPEEPYVFVPVDSFKGQQLPGVSYLLIPKKYENKVSEYLTSKTR
ncbi:hypothetical protein COOONC_28443 [Cooperia oncophora]